MSSIFGLSHYNLLIKYTICMFVFVFMQCPMSYKLNLEIVVNLQKSNQRKNVPDIFQSEMIYCRRYQILLVLQLHHVLFHLQTV